MRMMVPEPRVNAPPAQPEPPTRYGMVEGQDSRVLADSARRAQIRGQIHAHIAVDDTRLAALSGLVHFFAPDIEIIKLPGWDCLPYDRVSPGHDVSAARIAALSRLLQVQDHMPDHPILVIMTVGAVIQRVMVPDSLRTHHLQVRVGSTLPRAAFEKFLSRNGYARTDTVRDSGEFAIRGGIIDLFPSGAETPVRIDLFGDEVESIKLFDPVTQRSDANIPELNLIPATEYGLDEESIAAFRSGYRDAFGVPSPDDPLYTAITEGRRYNGAEHWLPLFYSSMACVFDYLPSGDMTVDPQINAAVDDMFGQIDDYYTARRTLAQAGQGKSKTDIGSMYHPLPPDRLYVSRDEWGDLSGQYVNELFSAFQSADDAANRGGATRGRDFADIRAQPKVDLFVAVATHLQTLKSAIRRVLIACYSVGARDRMMSLLTHAGVSNLAPCDDFAATARLHPVQIALVVLPLEHGFVADDLAVLTEQDILGDRLVRGGRKKKKSEHFIAEIASLTPGDLVVHVDHGIGRFEGLETITAAGTMHDCLKLTYDGGDRLYLPVENMDLLSRFGAEEGMATLDRLGGAGWQARKARVKRDLMAMADELLKVAAARALRTGERFACDEGGYAPFVARFPYHETEDQQRAIGDVFDDLLRGTPADRLVCGDVGFGKTEVALRAAYIVAATGAQVAVVVPTTLLARQHYNNFIKRFDGTGIRVGQLSRMVNARDMKLTKAGLADGSIQIVIGTHAIFAKDVKFAHLGLMIVDEEQRFGVKQKEALKNMKNDVHVVTLTATPIPRTLQMALTGVRDMSIIASAPVDRLAIRTTVLPFDPLVIREAIMRERHRGGQTFYVCPRIKDMATLEERLRDLVPEIRIVTAHGQLTPTELDDRMTAFYEGQYDVLLATNIIESGLDIPTANTMIVHRSDLFGLSQLYQIRGRIGRSKVRAYAYLTYDGDIKLTPEAQRRLEVIEMLDSLGSGFQLASHDMDIRGAGNLLGEKQSGHVREIGVELYQQMLEDAVAAARAQNDIDGVFVADQWSPSINLGTSILIPETYVIDLTLRLNLYRRLTTLEDKAEIEGFAAELIDRFGPIPPEVENLLDLIEIKKLCRQAGVAKVDAGPKGAVIGFYQDLPPNLDALLKWLMTRKGTITVRPDQKLVAIREWDNLNDRVKGVRSILKDMVQVAGGGDLG